MIVLALGDFWLGAQSLTIPVQTMKSSDLCLESDDSLFSGSGSFLVQFFLVDLVDTFIVIQY